MNCGNLLILGLFVSACFILYCFVSNKTSGPSEPGGQP